MSVRFHQTVTLPISGRTAGLRVILTDTGVFQPLVSFMTSAAHKNKSTSWQEKCCYAVGLLLDYASSVPFPDHPARRRRYFSDFIQALTEGTISQSGVDPLGLYWHPASWKSLAEVVRFVNPFLDYCVQKFDAPALNPMTEAGFVQRLAAFRRFDKQNENSLLKHLGSRKAAWKNASLARETNSPRLPKVALARPPFFPRDQVLNLFQRGFCVSPSGPLWHRYNLRDLMIAILQRFGGLRECEPLQLFVTDVFEIRDKPGQAEVRLYHPELGRFTSIDQVTRKLTYQKRSEFLRLRYGRISRNQMHGKERAGWKDLLLDYDEPHNYCLVRWFPAIWGRVFLTLYQLYVNHVLPSGLTHPYLFINLSGPAYGAPYRLSAYNLNLGAAVHRIGQRYEKGLGTTSHGLRHGYAQDLEEAGFEDELIQLCMHHKSILSQGVYKRPTFERVNRELNRGQDILRAKYPVVGGFSDESANIWKE